LFLSGKHEESFVDTQAIVDWYKQKRRAQLSAGEAQEVYFLQHPRTSFLKMLPTNSSVVDIGAGDGSLSVFRSWPKPLRTDLQMHAYSIEKGSRFDDFEGYELSDWNERRPQFPGLKFDAAISAHFIEHIADPYSIADWLREHLAENGRAYIEWPSPYSLRLPSRSELLKEGVDLMISRFDDDDTHRAALPERSALCNRLSEQGFEVEQEGMIRMPWIEHQLMATLRDSQDAFPRQAAFWLMTGWSQFVIAARKP
jgi:SAM-dependent methyltransferase